VDLDPLTRADAASEFPGAGQVEQSFLIILGLYGFVVPLVTGLFFLIITFQKTRALTLLRAVGCPLRRARPGPALAGGFILGGGHRRGGGVVRPDLARGRSAQLTIRLRLGMVAFWTPCSGPRACSSR
jgi:putative ABC transport system permease protein